MSYHNPSIDPAHAKAPDEAIQPNSPDFAETPDVPPLSTEKQPLPVWLYLVCGFALFMAGSSFTGFGTFGLGLLDQGPGGPTLTSAGSQEATAPENPLALGKKVYGSYCANCHQASGMGQPGSYPPMVNSEWVLGSKERLAAILLHGVQGPITVNGGSYGTMQMQAWGSVLTPDKIADVMTYIRGSWGNTAGPVMVDEVNAAQAKFTSQSAAWTQDELLKIAPHGPDPTDKKP